MRTNRVSEGDTGRFRIQGGPGEIREVPGSEI
jgi:hypothetical protein